MTLPTPRTLCLCGHRWDWHHGIGSQPCGSGSCDCRAFHEVTGPIPEPVVMATDLFGEVRPLPSPREDT